MPPGTLTADVHTVRDWVERVFIAEGLEREAAAATADCLAFAEARGVRSHGFIRTAVYRQRLLAGGISRTAQPVVTADEGALVLLDARHAIGAATGVFATRLAMQRARKHGIGCVIASNANHFGAAGYYTAMMADSGMFGIATSNTDKAMCAPGGGAPVLGTNPLAIAVPVEPSWRPQLDMATTEVSLGKLLAAGQDGEAIPLGWAVDDTGRPTAVPEAGLRGALLPSGGPKGFGLAFMIDALVAIAGAEISPKAGELYGDPSKPQRLGLAFIAVRTGLLGGSDAYAATVSELVDRVHRSGPGPDGAPALAPGEPELRREERLAGRVELSAVLMDELASIAHGSGVPLFA